MEVNIDFEKREDDEIRMSLSGGFWVYGTDNFHKAKKEIEEVIDKYAI